MPRNRLRHAFIFPRTQGRLSIDADRDLEEI
jgi:hypothetical protein